MSTRITEGEVRSADGTSIGYLKVGSGPALVVAHGSLSTGDEWLPVANGLADRFTCYLMDRRGRGRSGGFGEYSLSKEAEDAKAVLDAAGSESALLGHSYGAVCALEAARRYSVPKLILYEPPLPIHGSVVGPAFEDFKAAVAQKDFDQALTIALRDIIKAPEADIEGLRSSPQWAPTAALTPTWIPECEVMKRLEPGTTRFADVTTPTLLLLGTATPPHHKDATRALQDTLPDARTVEIADQGHVAHLAATDEVVAAIARFLEDTEKLG